MPRIIVGLMDQATRSGAIVMPPAPGFCSRPSSLGERATQIVGGALDLLDIHRPVVKRWKDAALPSGG